MEKSNRKKSLKVSLLWKVLKPDWYFSKMLLLFINDISWEEQFYPRPWAISSKTLDKIDNLEVGLLHNSVTVTITVTFYNCWDAHTWPANWFMFTSIFFVYVLHLTFYTFCILYLTYSLPCCTVTTTLFPLWDNKVLMQNVNSGLDLFDFELIWKRTLVTVNFYNLLLCSAPFCKTTFFWKIYILDKTKTRRKRLTNSTGK